MNRSTIILIYSWKNLLKWHIVTIFSSSIKYFHVYRWIHQNIHWKYFDENPLRIDKQFDSELKNLELKIYFCSVIYLNCKKKNIIIIKEKLQNTSTKQQKFIQKEENENPWVHSWNTQPRENILCIPYSMKRRII